MHPILGRTDRLASYLAAWVLAAGLLSAVLTRLGLDWLESLVFIVPLFLVYAFACLSAWYLCRAQPLDTLSLPRLLASSALTAVTASAVWLAVARAWMLILVATPAFASATDRYALRERRPLVSAVHRCALRAARDRSHS